MVGVPDPELDGAGDLALVAGEGGAVDGQVLEIGHCADADVGKGLE